jgi:hypothetical protein
MCQAILHADIHSCLPRPVRVMERYPGNGKLLRAYGKFLEDVKHDPWAANRQYQEALKVGVGDSMINLGSYVGADGKQLSWLSSVDVKVDGIVVANAQGSIVMVNLVGAGATADHCQH